MPKTLIDHHRCPVTDEWEADVHLTENEMDQLTLDVSYFERSGEKFISRSMMTLPPEVARTIAEGIQKQTNTGTGPLAA